jgi:hypothetical protein
MKYRLSGVPSVVDDQAVSVLCKPHLPRKVLRDKEQMSNEFPVICVHALYVRNMFIGHDQDMRRRLRIDIFEGNSPVIAVYELGWDLATGDHAKKTIRILAHGIISL